MRLNIGTILQLTYLSLIIKHNINELADYFIYLSQKTRISHVLFFNYVNHDVITHA